MHGNDSCLELRKYSIGLDLLMHKIGYVSRDARRERHYVDLHESYGY